MEKGKYLLGIILAGLVTTIMSQPVNGSSSGGPVVGVITQVFRDYKRFVEHRSLHLPSSYVKWLESAGARILPIMLNQNDSYYEHIFAQTNGLLFPGGDNLLDPNKRTPMLVAARKLYRLAKEANERGEFYPIWGTCLGMELLTVLSSDNNTLVGCHANDLSLKLEFVDRGEMFRPQNYANLTQDSDFSGQVVKALETRNLTYHFHHFCITDESLRVAKLDKFYRPLAYSRDANGLKFVTIFEAKDYPFYGVQFHPEKAPFEFRILSHQKHIPHSRDAIAISRYFADFFISQTLRNKHRPNDDMQLEKFLIYEYRPIFTGILGDMYEQRYVFRFTTDTDIDTSEFVDRVLENGESVNEDVDSITRSSQYTI